MDTERVHDEEIHGRRVVLAPLRAPDADELAALLDDVYVRDALGVGDVEGLRRRFAAWESRRSPDGRETWLNWISRENEASGRVARAAGFAPTDGSDAGEVIWVLAPGCPDRPA